MTPTTALGLSIRLSMFELREICDWDIFLPGPPERARAETSGADQWVLKRRECSGFARVNKVISASLGYPLSVFNKNSTLQIETFSIDVMTTLLRGASSICHAVSEFQVLICFGHIVVFCQCGLKSLEKLKNCFTLESWVILPVKSH